MKAILVIFLGLVQGIAMAQQTEAEWEQEGEIDDAEVVIEKDREITLPSASRRFERVPPLEINKPTTEVSYEFQDVTPVLPGLNPSARPLKIKNPPLDKLYGNYAKIGFGTFLTPYAELFANNTRNDEYDYGFHLYHLSSRYGPVDGANSGNSDTKLGLNSKYFGNGHTLHAEVSYQRERYHFYGYSPLVEPEPERDSIKQIFNSIVASVGISREEVDEPFDYDLNAQFIHFDDFYQANENQIILNMEVDYAVSPVLGVGFESDLYFMRRANLNPEIAGEAATNRILYRGRPYFTLRTSSEPDEGLVVKGGFTIAHENDTASNADQLHIYPFAQATLFLSDGFQVYGELDGNIEATSLYQFTRENPYLAPDVPLLHTNRNFGLRGGIKGRLSSLFGFNLGVAANNYKNLYFYVNSPQDSTRFTILYDPDNVFRLNLYGELMLSSAERFRSTFRADYFLYNLTDFEEPWHRPDVTLSWLNSVNIYEKLLLNIEFQLMSGISGLNLASGTTRELNTITDLNFQADYLFSNRFSAFVKVKNIFAQNYERFLNYPSRGILFMGGITYSF